MESIYCHLAATEVRITIVNISGDLWFRHGNSVWDRLRKLHRILNSIVLLIKKCCCGQWACLKWFSLLCFLFNDDELTVW